MNIRVRKTTKYIREIYAMNGDGYPSWSVVSFFSWCISLKHRGPVGDSRLADAETRGSSHCCLIPAGIDTWGPAPGNISDSGLAQEGPLFRLIFF